mgnify:CR=1 FL=1
MNRQRHFCAIVIGDLGKVGALSLSSISNLNDVDFCYMADSSGFNWVNSMVRDHDLKLKLCHHPIPKKLNWLLEDFDSNSKYSNFGHAKFFRLMHLKWQIVFEALKENKSKNGVIFSDLDIYWRSFPESAFSSIISMEKDFGIQKDWNKERNIFYCPGIMIWSNTPTSISTLIEIQTFHRELMRINENLPDDKALNKWLLLGANINRILPLSEIEFVIGHRLPQLLLKLDGFSVQRMIAFHANYANGLTEKYSNLLTISQAVSKDFRWIFGFSKFISRKLKNKLS